MYSKQNAHCFLRRQDDLLSVSSLYALRHLSKVCVLSSPKWSLQFRIIPSEIIVPVREIHTEVKVM